MPKPSPLSYPCSLLTPFLSLRHPSPPFLAPHTEPSPQLPSPSLSPHPSRPSLPWPRFPRHWPGGRRQSRRLEQQCVCLSVCQGSARPAPARPRAQRRAEAAERGQRRRRRQRQVPGTGHRSGHCSGHCSGQGVRGEMRDRGMPSRASPAWAGPAGRCPRGCGGAPRARGWRWGCAAHGGLSPAPGAFGGHRAGSVLGTAR